jgi:hypothetical protein
MLRGLIAWCLIMVLETVHGILRGLYLVPLVGQAEANRIGWPVGAIIVLTVATLLRPWTGLRGPGALFRLGLMWAALTLTFEIIIGFARGMSALEVANDFNPLTGGLGLYTIAFMLAAPWLAARLRGL